MAAATDELILLERVFLRLGSVETDEQLQAAICKFLPPVLLKLSSSQEAVRKKVMELLIHINKRIKSRPQVQLPVEALLLQYQDPAASSFVTNFTIIYIKLGYPRMEIKKQAELVPSVLNAIQGKPLSHQDSLMLLIMPALGHINIPMDSDKRNSFLNLQDHPQVTKQLLNFMLDMLLLPYGAISQNENQQANNQQIDWAQQTIPSGMSLYAFKRVIGDNLNVPENLEQTKLGIINFIAGGFLSDSDILIHLIVASADTRFSIADLAEMKLRKIVNTLDWSSMQLAAPLYTLFLGTQALSAAQKEIKPEMKRTPANTRIRLKLLYYLCKVTKTGFIIPPCIQVVFDSLYGTANTNSKLKSLALQFTFNFVQQCSLNLLDKVAQVILNGMLKLINEEAEHPHRLMAYTVIGQLGQRIPNLVNKDLSLLQNFFKMLESSEGDMKRTIRDALISMTSAFVLTNVEDNEVSMMVGFLSAYIESPEAYVRFVTVHYLAEIFPPDHAPSRYLLLLASGDQKLEVQTEALKALYGTSYKNERSKYFVKQSSVPEFSQILDHIYSNIQIRITSGKKISIGNKILPFNTATFSEIISYLRICLSKSSNIVQQNESLEHPCDQTPLIGRYLQKLHKENSDSLYHYIDIVVMYGQAVEDEVALCALLEIIGTIPFSLVEKYSKEISWIRNLLNSKKEFIRVFAAKLYAFFISHSSNTEFENENSKLLNATKDKILEIQHGALLAISFMMERKLFIRKNDNKNEIINWSTYVNTVKTINDFFDSNNTTLLSAAIDGIGLIGKTYSLPFDDDKEGEISKKFIVDKLISIFANVKTSSKIKEKVALSLGLLCIGEDFPYSKMIAEKLIDYAEETKDLNMHLCIGEALVYCVQGPGSPEARDSWKVLPSENFNTFNDKSNDLLGFVLDKLLSLINKTNPNSRQATCIWLLTIVSHNLTRECVLKRMLLIHNAFLDFLAEKSDILQDIATKGLFLVYNNSLESQKNELSTELMNKILYGKNEVISFTSKSSTSKETDVGLSSTSGSLTAYKEICGLAYDLQNHELAYQFFNLANKNSPWTLKKGATLGTTQITDAGKDLKCLKIIPKLYRYQFDPIPKVQQIFTNIWKALVPSTTKALEQHHKEIIESLTINLTHDQFRVRISCCLALTDIFKTTSITIKWIDFAPGLWVQLLKVMDDIHEGTRTAATNTTKIFSRVCIRQCDASQGKSSEEFIQKILPILLEKGINHTDSVIRVLSLQTVSQLVNSAGILLKPSLPVLIPALLNAMGEIEDSSISQVRNILANSAEAQEVINSHLEESTKSHFSVDTMTKCIQFIDSEILKELMPKIIELMKSTLRFGTKIACSNFLIKLSSQIKQDFQPYAGKTLTVLLNGLMDRNTGVKKNYAITIGHIVGCAKESSINKLLNTLNSWYMEKDDDAVSLSIAQVLQSINNYNQDIIKKYSNLIIPLVFFAMHAEKTPENQKTVELWNEVWLEITPGSEAGIKQNLNPIINTLNTTLESSSWKIKAQAANVISTLATKVGSSIDNDIQYKLIEMLISGLQGRTWSGKERLLNALSVLSSKSKESLEKNTKLKDAVIEVLFKESKKENLEYRCHALKAFTDTLHELNEDKFSEVYEMSQEILEKISKKSEDDDDDSMSENKKRRENKIKLQEVVYEGLGKAWPSCKETQDKYSLQFIIHCQEALPNITRPIQVTILTTVGLFVDKLILLKTNSAELNASDKEKLDNICKKLLQILRYAIGIAKYTRIRKEALNIVIYYSKKLKESNHMCQLENLTILMKDMLIELLKDNQPEIRSRIADIKDMLKL